MGTLFDPWSVNGLRLPNRFVRSATVDNLADRGVPSERQLNLFRELARGGVGLIVTGGLFPTREGQVLPGQLGAHSDETVPALRILTQHVHDHGGLIAAQLMHGGWYARAAVTGLASVGPSPMVNPRTGEAAKGLPSEAVYRLADAFVQAARRAVEAGFDAVQIHAAHSWLISAFLSPATNQRDDEWGGSSENRSRLLVAIVKGIRALTGPRFPVLVKLGLKDYHPAGKSVAEGLETAKALVAAGIDAIELSEGLEAEFGHHIRRDATSPYFLEEAVAGRGILGVPIILVGGFRSRREMQAVLDQHLADAISLCRPLVRDPHLVNRLREGAVDESECISCNGCLEEMRGGNLRCIHV